MLDNYFLYYFRNLDYPLYYPWNNHYLLNYLFNLNHSRNLNYLLYDSINELRLHFHYLFLHYNRHWFLDVDRFDDFLPGCYYFGFLYFNLFDFFRYAWHSDLLDNWNLFCNVKRNYLLYFHVSGGEHFLDDGLVDENLNLSDAFLFVSLDEVRAVNEDLFGDFSDDFLLDFQFNINRFFYCVGADDRFVSVFAYLNKLYFWHSDFNWNLYSHLYLFLFLDYVGHSFLYL